MAIDWEQIKENAKKQDEAKYGAAKPETQNASPVAATKAAITPKISSTQAPVVSAVVKTPNMSQLEAQRLQAAKNEDWYAVDQINAQMKALRAAAGQQTLADRVQDTVSGTVYTEIGQTAGALGMLGREGNKLEQWGEQTTQQGEKQIQGAKEGLGGFGQALVDLGVGATQIVGDVGLSALAPGAGLAAMGVRAFGGGAQQARQEGATRGEQLGYGAASAAASILVERIANVAGPFKKAFGNGILNKALDKVAAKPAGKLVMSSLSEGGEEMLEAALDPILQKLTYNPDAAYNEDVLAEMLYSGALGAVLGGFGGGVDVVTGRGKTTPEATETEKTTQNTPLNLEGVTPERRKAFTQAQKIAERFGATLNVATLENGAGGRYLNGQITIDPTTENPVRQVLVHELTHHMETSGLYHDFSREIMDYMQRDMGIDLDDMRLQIMEDYAARGTALDSDGADRELVAKFAEDMLFRDEKAVRRLLEKDRNLFQRIYDWIRTAKVRLKGTAEERFLMEAESLYERALQQAGTITGSAEAQNTFGGVNARTANLNTLATAQQMEAQGMDADAIRRETKWFRGMDGKWRFEIDDSGMKYFRSGDAAFTQNHPEYAEYQGLVNQMLMGTMTPEQEARMRALNDTWGREQQRLRKRVDGGGAYLSDIIQHDALFEAYPEMKVAWVRFADLGGARGTYSYKTHTITLDESMRYAPENTLIHEVQHAVQDMEGFAGGSSPQYWENRMEQGEEFQERDAKDLYRNTAGEIEARDAASRRKLTPEQRELKMPTLGDANTVFAESGYMTALKASEDAEILHLKDQIRANLDAISQMPYVANISAPTSFPNRLSDRRDWVMNNLKTTEVDRPGLGTVKIEVGQIRKGLTYAKTPGDIAAFLAVPNVIKRGKWIEKHENHKGNGIYSDTFAAPVVINGTPGVLGVVVQKTKGNNYKAHKILLPDGSAFVFEENKNAEFGPVMAQPQMGRLDERTNSVFNNSIRAENQNVKDPYDIMPKLDPEGKYSQGKSFRELYMNQMTQKKPAKKSALNEEQDPYDIMPKLTATTIPTKAQESLKKTENALLRRIGRALSVPVGVQRSDLKELVRSISNEYLRDGKVSQESLDALFDEAYEKGVEVDTEYYDQHKDIKNILRNTAVTISKEDRSSLVGGYTDFRKAAMGTLKIANDGTPVDILYARLSEQEPTMFPESIIHPADQLQRMFEVGKNIQKVEKTLDNYYGENAIMFRAFAKRDFNDAVNETMAELNNVRRYSEEAARKQASKMASTPEQVKAAYDNIRTARKARERTVNKNLLTDSDNAQVSRLLKGEIQLNDLDPKRYNVRGIREVYEAKLEYEQIARVIREYKKQHSQQLRDEAETLLKTSASWKDKKAGALYSRETMERNIRDIVPDPEVAAQITRKYFTPVHSSQAASTRAKNAYRDRVKKLGLSRKVAKGNEVSEAHAVQLLGEAEDNIRVLQNSKEKNPMRDGQTLQEWNLTVQKLKNNNPNMDWAKVDNAVKEFREIYDELFQKMNEVRLRNGYEPVAYRQGYFPHFRPGETGLLASFGAALGITTDVTDLPTSINGMTHTFKPGITWFGHAQERKGFDTAYDAVQGFDKYIEGAADVIYQTDNIQRLRALANQIRYRAGDEGLKKQIDEINANENLTEDQKQAAIEQTHKEGGFALSNFVVELEEYTNLLANKKSRADRNMEQAMGRRMYNIIKGLEGRVAANMVAVNPGSWLTNFIPITQGMSSLNTKALLTGMWDTLKAYKTDDGMVELSTFLTNRRGSDPLVRTWTQNASDFLSKPMSIIDSFTADTLVRSRFNQNVSEGMSVNEALEEADAWAAKVMADRSKGSMPTVFNRHNPLTKVFTQFQLEVNNQMSYLFKDVPDEMKEKGLKALAVALMKMFVGAYLYNEVYEHFIGRRPALDPIGILVETGKNIAGGEMDAYEVLTEAGTDVVENLPFVGGLIGGGRLPISSALPNPENLGKALLSEDWDPKKKRTTIAKELTAPAAYLLSPFGGGQIKKAVQGVNAVRKGGSYTVDSKGEDVLQYPILSDTAGGKAKDYLQAAVFGKSSLPEAQSWVKQGFNSLSGKETATYQDLMAAGEDGRTSFDLLQVLGNVEGTEIQSESYLKRNVLRGADLSDEGKSILYYNMLANDTEKELMDAASAEDREKSAGLLMDMKDANLLKGDTAKKAKYYALLESDASDEMKIAVYNQYVTDSKEEEIRNMLDQGVKFNEWLQFEAKTGNLSSDDDETRKEKVIDALQDLNLSEDKKAAMYFASAATDSDKKKQRELEASNGITRTQYWQYQQVTAGMTKKAEKLAAIDSLDLTPDQKTALYFANRWAESTLDDAPWFRSSQWDITPKLAVVPQTVNGKQNPFLEMPKLTGTSGTQKTTTTNPFLVMPKL